MAASQAHNNSLRCLYIYNRSGACLHYHVWSRTLTTLDPQQDQKLMFGLLFSLKSFTSKLDPVSTSKGNLGVPQFSGQGCSFHSFSTNTYKLSLMETPSGIKLVLVTDPKMGDLRPVLKHVYTNIFVESEAFWAKHTHISHCTMQGQISTPNMWQWELPVSGMKLA